MLKFPQDWAASHNMTQDRVSMDDAIGFVNHVQGLTFGNLIQLRNQSLEANRNPETDRAYNTEKELQDDLEQVVDDLREKSRNGQQTISTRKVFRLIETTTGYDFELE